MSHIHNIVDVDCNFFIDPDNRSITTESERLILVKGDHNSERYTFQIPRYVEGHDMTLCDRVEIHFTNITRNKKQKNEDVYIVDDLGISTELDIVTFSWLVSKNATQLEGSLKFSITFLCFDDDTQIEYEWGTSEFDKIQILKKQNNTAAVIESNPDLFEEMRQDIEDLKENGVGSDVTDDLEKVLQDILEAIQQGGTTSTTIDEIEQIIVSYFENKTVGEVEA